MKKIWTRECARKRQRKRQKNWQGTRWLLFWAQVNRSEWLEIRSEHSRAFGTIQHEKSFLALHRLGVHEHFVDVIKNCYCNPYFFVQDEYGSSDCKRQNAGIRQGCPLSPCLFVWVVSVIDRGISDKLDTRIVRSRKPGIGFGGFAPLMTVFLTTSTYATNRILWAVKGIFRQFGLTRNRDKFSYITMNGNNVFRCF